MLGQPLSEHRSFPRGPAGDGLGLDIPGLSTLFSQRFMVGIDTEKVFATSSLGLPASTAESTLNLRSFECGFMPGGYHICGSILTGAAVRPREETEERTEHEDVVAWESRGARCPGVAGFGSLAMDSLDPILLNPDSELMVMDNLSTH